MASCARAAEHAAHKGAAFQRTPIQSGQNDHHQASALWSATTAQLMKLILFAPEEARFFFQKWKKKTVFPLCPRPPELSSIVTFSNEHQFIS